MKPISPAVFTQYVINALHAKGQSKELSNRERDLIQVAYNANILEAKVVDHIIRNREEAV